jgi:nucleoside-diphosphate-sugar epimerase
MDCLPTRAGNERQPRAGSHLVESQPLPSRVVPSLPSFEDLVVVTGAGGFIGGHLVRVLQQRGHTKIRAVDVKPLNEWYQKTPGVENQVGDLALLEPCRAAAKGARMIYNLAADMGGMGFIETHKAECMLSVLVSTHMLVAAKEAGTERFFYSSSACVYNGDKQTRTDVTALKEEDAYPAMPEDGYGWEKLFSERMARHYREDYGIATRVARYHNVYGPEGTYDGGREKAPAAICRKVIAAKLSGKHEIEIWGDGEQTRSFMYIDDCTDGTIRLAASDIIEPLNIGSDELVSINRLVDIVEKIAGVKLKRSYKLDAPKGVRGRNSDNTLIKKLMNWAPSIRLEDGMEKTYKWIHDEMTSGKASVVNALPRAVAAR